MRAWRASFFGSGVRRVFGPQSLRQLETAQARVAYWGDSDWLTGRGPLFEPLACYEG